MKYIIELDKIEGTNLYRVVGASTMVFDEWVIENVLKPYHEPESEPVVDWSTIAVNTPIVVSSDGEHWKKRHFAEYKNGRVFAWDNGTTSFTQDIGACPWDYAKLVEVKK